ncbi:segregation/condensation protein A [Moraxella catarrhalis]|uniref:segregation and condensation protein A n=1 Tax=Moraxella catarrhalis TaxID=480 RepID=UPI00128D6CDF|nr:ScpA family protein [Moraxella catarrhalis]MPW80725.1 segregation/condensation protein A [Moraxella catarrhalis]MPX35924.1 segregation/condensation protein A [Moraxella catarrhalis]MPX57463.1 segregation/condensation protein A [Moraxella catarrhalis]
MITISNNPAPSKTADVRIFDTPVLNLPEDLYIPPQAFAIWLEQFAGPLDFLLYLVKKNNFDLTETAILPITEQYLSYISELDEAYFELAGDYLLMASTLIAIKSELLLPQSKIDDDEISPKARLIRRLEEYAQIKEAARRIDSLLRLERDVFLAFTSMPSPEAMQKQLPKYSPELLVGSLIHMKIRPEAITHTVQADSVPLSQRIASITRLISEKGVSTFAELIDKSQGKIGIVVSFVAVLELMKRGLIGFDDANSGKLNPTKNDTDHNNQNGQDLTKQSLHWLH